MYPLFLLPLLFSAISCSDGDGSSQGSPNGGTGASSGAGGSGGSGGSGGGSNDVQTAKMVKMPAGFWIDSTEVTRAQYNSWLRTNPSLANQLPVCSWNTDFTPGCRWNPGEEPNHPVVCVDWCDAYAYCKGVGKRLCGKIGGGSMTEEELEDTNQNQWYYACTSGGVNQYPYGNEHDPNACNVKDSGYGDTAPAGYFQDCQSSEPGFEGVFDMVGNVYEWFDSCLGSEGKEDRCYNGSSTSGSLGIRRDCEFWGTDPRNESWGGLGFRCCKD